jgi:excisionase family DNA binding protein
MHVAINPRGPTIDIGVIFERMRLHHSRYGHCGGSSMTTADLMTKTDIANRVGCHPRTIDNLIARKQGPVAIRIGRLIRFRQTDFDAWLDRHCGDPIPSPSGDPSTGPAPGRI